MSNTLNLEVVFEASATVTPAASAEQNTTEENQS